MTGQSKQHIGGGNTIGYQPVADIFAEGFRAAGCHVDHRRASIGEDLTGYDAVVMGMIPFFSIASTYLYESLDVIDRAQKAGIPLIFFLDDWGFSRLRSNLNTHLNDHNQLIREFFKFRPGHAWANEPENHRRLMDLIHRLRYDPWPPVIAPAFSWGNHQMLADRLPEAGDFTGIDVSVMAKEYPVKAVAYQDRSRQWVLGTVSDQLKWMSKLNASWPIRHIGSKAAKAPEKMPESQLVQLYVDNWGVLSPLYTAIVGSGWWRNRFVYAARVRSILYADPREVAPLGEPYLKTVAEIEDMTSLELRELAEAQASAFFARQPSMEQVESQLQDVIKRATERTE